MPYLTKTLWEDSCIRCRYYFSFGVTGASSKQLILSRLVLPAYEVVLYKAHYRTGEGGSSCLMLLP